MKSTRLLIRQILQSILLILLSSSMLFANQPLTQRSGKTESGNEDRPKQINTSSATPLSPRLVSDEQLTELKQQSVYGSDHSLQQVLQSSHIQTNDQTVWFKKGEEISIAATMVDPITEAGSTAPGILLYLSLKGNLYPLLLDVEQNKSIRVQALGTLQAWRIQQGEDDVEMIPIPPFILENNTLVASGEIVTQGIGEIIGCILSKIFSLDKLCKYLTCVGFSASAGFVGCLTVFLPDGDCEILGNIDDLLSCVQAGSTPPIPTLSVSPATQSAGSPINYSGNNYSPGTAVNILIYRQSGGASQPVLFTTTANSSGHIGSSFNLGATANPGNYVAIGQDVSRGYSKGANFVITSQPGGNQGTCTNPYVLTSGQPFNGNTSGGQSIYSIYSCATSWNESGPERVHRITLNSPGTISVSLTNHPGGDLDVFVLSSCGTTCMSAFNDSGTVPASLLAGTYYIIVDGYQGAVSSYTLTVNVGGGGSSSTPQLYSVTPLSTPIAGQQFFARLDGSNFNTSNVQVVAIGPGCPNTSSCVVPTNVLGGVTSTRIASAPLTLGVGTYDIHVRNGAGTTLSDSRPLTVGSGSGGGSGTCSSPYLLALGQNFNGNTSGGATNFNSYNCVTNWNESGPMRIHTITIPTARTITATLSNLGANDLDVFILSSCGTNSCLAYGDNSASVFVQPGTYYIVVDGYSGAVGGYTLRVQ